MSGARAKPHVVYWFNQPTPYVVARFNALADRSEMSFEAWFSDVRQPDRSWAVDPSTWRFKARYLEPRLSRRGQGLKVPIAELKETRPDLFVLEYDRLNLALGALAGRRYAGRLAFRVLPNFDAWSDRTWWREAAKHTLFRSIDGAKVPGPDGGRLAHRYGCPDDRIARVRQSIDLEHYRTAHSLTDDERRDERRALGLRGCVFVFVGRIWRGKGLDELLDAYDALDEVGADVSMLVIGDGVDEVTYRRRAARHKSVVFTGFVQPADLPRWYALADCLVFPTHGDPNGLVVEEALAAGLPVIVSDAAGDIHQRVEGAGIVVPVGDSRALAEAMLRLATDDGFRESLRQATAGLVAEKDVSGYASDFVTFVDEILRRRPRRWTAAGALGWVSGAVLGWTATILRWKASETVKLTP